MTAIYKLTVFDPSGEKLLDESFSAENNEEAKETGTKLLKEKGYENQTHRCASPQGSLVLFHR